MNPASVRASYRNAMAKGGEVIGVRRYTGTGTNRPYVEIQARARVTGYQADELVGGIAQGDRKVILLYEDLVSSGFPLPLTRTDKLIIRGIQLAIHNLDDSTRRIDGALIAYEITARG